MTEEQPPPEGGRPAERLRQFMDARLPRPPKEPREPEAGDVPPKKSPKKRRRPSDGA